MREQREAEDTRRKSRKRRSRQPSRRDVLRRKSISESYQSMGDKTGTASVAG
jgi:hypothetical protein